MSILLKNGLVYLPDGTVSKQNIGIEGARIDYLAAKEPGRKYDEVKDMSGKLLIPGLVNAHTHAAMTLLRGVGSDLSLQEWLFEKIVPIEDKLTPDDIRVGTELAMLEMLACGTTSFSDMYFFPEVTAEAVISSGMKANLNRPVQSFDPSERGEDSRRIKEALALYEGYNGAGDGRVKIDFCVHAEYTCTEAVTRYLANIVREKRGNLHIHLSETEKEQRQCIEKYGKTPLRWFYDLGALDSRAFCAHCVWVTDEDMELMTKLGIGAVHNPTSNLKLGSGFAPVQKMLDLGINVALGTDGASSNNNLNMLEEMHLASIIHNGYTGDPTIMKPASVIRMATKNGAIIQGRADTGEIKVGMRADITAIDLSAPHLRPNVDTPALLCYSAQSSDVCMTMADGRVLYENGEYLTLDRERILFEAERAAKRLYN